MTFGTISRWDGPQHGTGRTGLRYNGRVSRDFEVIVIGGGHAGAEAAWAAARIGAPTALITFRREAIGRMSCNPAVGGIGKGQMVREVDALGGLMGLATDRAAIQFRMLNRRKGPAVWAPRAQCDRGLYAAAVQDLLDRTPDLTILEGSVEDLLVEAGERPRVCGVRLADGRTLAARAVVVTSGTFLRALMHCGEQQTPGGRLGEPSAEGLSGCLRRLGLGLGRLKTGTPPRVARDSVDYSVLDEQPGDADPRPFSFLNDAVTQPQVSCWITWTHPDTHELIRRNLHRAPMYSGQIVSRGPRYCPSIEDKVVRFADKERHQVFLEPEGYESDRIYCNGISTSLPPDVQEPMVRAIRGLERARIVQWGYAVEYDFVPPHQTTACLETKPVAGLFLAGQINGTSGYEEAAGQGIVAGINAARRVQGREPVVLRRDGSYIGVMIDDLVTKGVDEPYRMFTSRAEYRLLLRCDNADERLTPVGREVGLANDARWERFLAARRAAAAFEAWLTARSATNGENTGDDPAGVVVRRLLDTLGEGDGDVLAEPLVREWAAEYCGDGGEDVSDGRLRTAAWSALARMKYAGYIRRQARQVERFARLEERRIPAGVDFRAVPHLRHEAREKFAAVGPASVGQALRISGVSPADVTLLLIHLERLRRGGVKN